jgi:hypothetical protein
MVDFWDTYQAKPAPPAVEQCSHKPCSQNETAGVCDWCGIASDDVLLGVCPDCV